jgi:hypothetical protein
MSRRTLTAAFWVVLTTLMMPSVHALDRNSVPNGAPAAPPMLLPPSASQSNAPPAQQADYRPNFQANHVTPASNPIVTGMEPMPIDANLAQAAATPTGPEQQKGYVRLGAPMYPAPQPTVPIWVGSTMITNQAFAPQEMLYPHTYRAIYPPFYHRVTGGWILTPLGVRSHEHWELQGTKVQVKYRSSYPGLLSGSCWHPHVDTHPNLRWK